MAGLVEIEGAPPGFTEPTFGQRLIGAVIDAALFAGVAFAVRSPIAVVALSALYSTTCTTLTGRTLGKRIVGTKVVDRATAEPPAPARAAARWLVLAGGSLVAAVFPRFDPLAGWAFIVLLPVLKPPLHRGLHDFAARTVVTACA